MAQSTENELVYITEEEMTNLQYHRKSKKKATIPKKFENMELSGANVNSKDIEDSNKISIQTQTDFVCYDANSEKIIIGGATTESRQIYNLQCNGQSFELIITETLKLCEKLQENGSFGRPKAFNTDEEEKSLIFSDNNSLNSNNISEITSLVNVDLTSDLSSRLDSLESKTDSVRHRTHSCDKTETNTYLKMLPIVIQNEENVAKIPKIDSNEVSSVMDCPNFGSNRDLESINNSDLVMEGQGSHLESHEAGDLRQSNDRLDSEEVIDCQGQHHYYEDVDNETDRSVKNVSRYKCRRIKLSTILFFLNILTIASLAIYISFKDSSGKATSFAGNYFLLI
ncbi:hypothetical protein KUTeg_009964 [Tegillarca granosa]|uniref:Uncharacterized protein n=1 Tax=Tegillarca granosa TaxID=220873 RepID=A0ABQ9F5E8_TEGGR|nr:hypothetical protein KUTeg_009964 [Tegillarca granosa]